MRQPDTLILGLGRFGGGLAAARFLLRQGRALRIADKAGAESLADAVSALQGEPDVTWCLQREDEALLDGVERVIVNPAIPDPHPLLVAARARGLAIAQEVNLFLEHYPGRVVLVTGTNGKSTTTTLLAKALDFAGMPVLAGGNIGTSLLDAESSWRSDQIAVLEISSFQLERLDQARHRVHGAVLVRITRDHLDRHGSLANYHRAKSVAAAVAEHFVVHAQDDPVASSFATPARRRILVSRRPPATGELGCENDWLVARLPEFTGRLCHAQALRLLGDFHRENVLAAAGAALLLGAAPHRLALGLCEQRPLPYRLQLLLTRDGKRLYDNAVSTEIESTESAVRTLSGPIHWVGGGKSKDGDYARVAAALVDRIASAHLFGNAARPLELEFAGRIPVCRHERVEQALASAWERAARGECVLFSPAFASFDQYPNFRARAQEFHAWARRLQELGPARADQSACGTESAAQ